MSRKIKDKNIINEFLKINNGISIEVINCEDNQVEELIIGLVDIEGNQDNNNVNIFMSYGYCVLVPLTADGKMFLSTI